MWLDFDVRHNSRCTFSLEEELWTHILDIKNMICLIFCLLQILTDGLEWCGLLWCFNQTLILTAPIHFHCWDTDAVMHLYKRPSSHHLLKPQWLSLKTTCSFSYNSSKMTQKAVLWTHMNTIKSLLTDNLNLTTKTVVTDHWYQQNWS